MRCDNCLIETGSSERHLWIAGDPQEFTFTFHLCNDCYADVKRNFVRFVESVKKRRETGQHDGSALWRY